MLMIDYEGRKWPGLTGRAVYGPESIPGQTKASALLPHPPFPGDESSKNVVLCMFGVTWVCRLWGMHLWYQIGLVWNRTQEVLSHMPLPRLSRQIAQVPIR